MTRPETYGHIQVVYQKVEKLQKDMIHYNCHPIFYTMSYYLGAPKENEGSEATP